MLTAPSVPPPLCHPPPAEVAPRRAARYAWAQLLARIYEVFPLGPPLWELPDAARDHFDSQAQPAPAYEFDQRIAW